MGGQAPWLATQHSSSDQWTYTQNKTRDPPTLSKISVARALNSSSTFSPVSALVSKNSMPLAEASYRGTIKYVVSLWDVRTNICVCYKVRHTALVLLLVAAVLEGGSRSILFPTRAIFTSLFIVFCRFATALSNTTLVRKRESVKIYSVNVHSFTSLTSCNARVYVYISLTPWTYMHISMVGYTMCHSNSACIWVNSCGWHYLLFCKLYCYSIQSKVSELSDRNHCKNSKLTSQQNNHMSKYRAIGPLVHLCISYTFHFLLREN